MSSVGEPLKLVSIENDGTFRLEKSKVSEILMQDNIKGRHLVVLSVAGAFRKGKSFLLGFILRYLKATVSMSIMLTYK